MMKIKVPKTEYVEQWQVGFITQIPLETEEDGDYIWVTFEDFVLDEDFTRTIQHPTEGEQEVTIPAGTYRPPFYNEEYEQVVL